MGRSELHGPGTQKEASSQGGLAEMTEERAIVAEAYLDRLVDASTLPWISQQVPIPGGTAVQAVKLLHANPATGQYAMLGRYPAGLVIPRHRHLAAVHSWILDGAWRFADSERSATSGCYSYEELGAVHTLVIEADTVAFHVIGGPQVVLDDDGGVVGLWDWEGTQVAWRRALADVGLAPTAWRPAP